jgi:hypothetical protein
MSKHKHDVESEGAKPRDHAHPRHPAIHFLKYAHRSWKVWVGVIFLIALMMVYIFSNDLSYRPGRRPTQQTPEAIP